MQFPKRRGQLLATVGLLAIVVGLLAAVGAVRTQAPPAKRRPFRMDTLATSADTVRAVVAYGRDTALHFVTVPGAGDDQLLHIGTCPGDTTCRHGPRSVIQPLEESYKLKGDWLAQGRIIARIITADTAHYLKYGIYGQDTVYWWAGLRHGETWSVFASTDSGAAPVDRRLYMDSSSHVRYQWRQSIARWLWDPLDEQAWTVCEQSKCCRS
jgi:hypothetical protein